MNLHSNEFPINEDLVRRLIGEQMPQWVGLPLDRMETSGTVNAIFRLGDDKVVRLPRTPDFSDGPAHEARWMPVFAPLLPLTVPEHRGLGRPTDEFPSPWSVLQWIEGEPAGPGTISDGIKAASTLGRFVAAMRTLPTDGAPEGGNYRAFGLHSVDRDFRSWLDQAPEDIDRRAVTGVWESCLAVDEWGGSPTWLHSDLRGDNLLSHNGKLVAVIDWEGCTVGDPAADLLAAWWLFDRPDSRQEFRVVSGADDPEWERAKGWALHMAIAAIPYYESSNPVFARQARMALSQILTDPV